MPERLDHAVISVRDEMDRAEAIYRRMGFTLTPRGFHPAGSCNHLMVFERDYLELIGFPSAGQTIRPDLLDAPIGLDGLVLATDDARAVYDRLRPVFPIGAPQRLTRMVQAGSTSEEARFMTARLPRDAFAGGRVYFCQHETPHLVWNEAWLGHRNGARAIDAFTIALDDPQAEAARYTQLLQAPIVRHDAHRITLPMGNAALVLTTPDALTQSLGSLECAPVDAYGAPRRAFMAMVSIRVADLAQVGSVLEEGGFAPQRLDSRTLVVPANQAMNCTVAFVSP